MPSILALAAAPAAAWSEPPVPVLDWRPCTDPGQEGFECATARVLLDYEAPQGATIELAVIRHRASEPAHRLGAIFWNPGGPGAPGTQTLPLALAPTTTAPLLLARDDRHRRRRFPAGGYLLPASWFRPAQGQASLPAPW